MARKRIDSLYDLEKIIEEASKVSALLEKQAEQIAKFSGVKLSFKTEGDPRKLSQAQTELSLNMREFESIQKQLATSQAKLNTLNSESAKKLTELKLQQQELNKANKEAAKDALGITDAYTKLARQYELAARQAQNLIITKGRDNEETKKAIATAQELGKQLKGIDADVLKFQRNVGNYANSLGDGFELVRREISRLQRDQKNFQIGGDTRGAEAAGRRIQELDNIIKVMNTDGQSFDRTVKQLERSYSNLATSGEQSNEFLQEFKRFVADAKDQADDLRQEIKALSSDTRKLDLVAGSISFIADSAQAAAGAAQLLGASEEDAAKATAQLVAIQSVANGLKGIATELTTKGTAANAAFAFVQRQVNIVMTEGIVTANGLKAAMGLLGLAVTVIGAIAIGIAAYRKSASDAVITQKNLNEALKEAGNEYAKAIQDVNSLRNNVELAKQGFISKEAVVKEYNESLGKTIGEVKTLDGVEQALNKNAQAYIDFTFAKATATAALAQASKLAVDAQLELLNPNNGEFANNDLLSEYVSSDRLKKADEEKSKERRESLNKQIDDLLKFAQQKQKEAAEIAKKNRFDFFSGEIQGGNNDDGAERSRQARFNTLQLELERQANVQKQIVEIETFSYDERLQALRQYIAIKSKLIEEEANFEKTKKGLTKDEINNIEAQKVDRLIQLSEEASKMFKITAKDAVQQTIDEMGELPLEVQQVFDQINASFEKYVNQSLGGLTEAQKQIVRDTQEAYIDAFQVMAATASDVLAGIFDGQKNRLQEQIDDIERLKAAEIDRINKSGDGEEKKAARIKVIEAKAQADREALERRQRQIDRQRAIAERAFKVFQITTDTIQAVNKIKLQIAAAPDPISKAFFTSQLVEAIASGAGSLVSLLATPIPKFATGKKATDSYEGIGLVGEAGREIGISKEGKMTVFDKPTLTYLRKGDTILPNKVTEDVIRAAEHDRLSLMYMFTGGKAIDDSSKAIAEQTEVLKRIEKKPTVIMQVHPAVETTAWFFQQLKN